MTVTDVDAFIDNSILRDYKLDCLIRFGPEKSRRILDDTASLCARMAGEETAPPDSPAGRHLYRALLPAAAYYRAMRAHGVDENEAADTVSAELQRTAKQRGVNINNLIRLPFGGAILRARLRKVIERDYLPAGWEATWDGGRGLRFTVGRCFYRDTLERLDAGGLCAAFCEAEKTFLDCLSPKITWERDGTLAQGEACRYHIR